MSCRACGAKFIAREAESPSLTAVSIAPEVEDSDGEEHRGVRRSWLGGPKGLTSTLWGFLTPPLVVITSVVLIPLLGPMGVLVAGPGVVGLAYWFCARLRASRSAEAYDLYERAASAGFLLEPILVIFLWLAVADEAAGLMLVPVAGSVAFLCILSAGAWKLGSAMSWWFRPTDAR